MHIPPSQRPGHDVWEFTGLSPAVQAYGEPDLTVPKPNENSQLRSFTEAAVLGQPGRYVQYVARDLVRIVDPSYPSSPYGAAGPTGGGYGNTPQSLQDYYFNPTASVAIQRLLTTYYPGDGTVHRDLSFLKSYERDTRIQGSVMVILLLLALAAPLLATGPQRRANLLFGATTVVLLAGPIFLSEYDYRFTIPAFGPLAAAASIGAWGAVKRACNLAAQDTDALQRSRGIFRVSPTRALVLFASRPRSCDLGIKGLSETLGNVARQRGSVLWPRINALPSREWLLEP